MSKGKQMSTIAATQPWLIEVAPERDSSRPKSLWEQCHELNELSASVGGLILPAMAAVLLDVHRSRVYQLMTEGRFTVHEFMDQKFLETREVAAFYSSERKAGRPRVTFKDQMKRAVSVGDEIAAELMPEK